MKLLGSGGGKEDDQLGKNEVYDYLQEPLFQAIPDLFQYWSCVTQKHTKLAKLAFWLLAVPAVGARSGPSFFCSQTDFFTCNFETSSLHSQINTFNRYHCHGHHSLLVGFHSNNESSPLRNRIGMKKTERKMPVLPLMEIWNFTAYIDENVDIVQTWSTDSPKGYLEGVKLHWTR
ncbi:hypothetical protein MJG53_003386 [Ovis ammon polii x Ovis aries]|uniref:Uncharacterized protein n=1 Tax=Ovis ammon polii x Ovis aries TaxID=2918886 RepID=A0ACB9VGN2_9CETA|nr:hypothetical protein MJG53_003386 [Ovis ammon polii x Ovis aries]